MKKIFGRLERGDRKRRSDRTLVSTRWRLWLAVLALALAPALVGVLATSTLTVEPDQTIATERVRSTSAAAADLLVREQRIESRLTALAANLGMSRLTDGITGQSERQQERRAVAALRGSDGPVIAGACLTRTKDAVTTRLGDAPNVLGPSSICATGTLLARAAASPVGHVERAIVRAPGGARRLLIATRLSDGIGANQAVLAAGIDLHELFDRTSSAAGVATVAMLVDTLNSTVVAASSNPPESPADAAVPSANELAVYLNGILSNHGPAVDDLERAGWVTTVATMLPMSAGSHLGLVHVWPAPLPPPPTPLIFSLIVLATVALIATVAFMRHLIRPFRDLEESQAQLANMYKEARQDSLHDGLTGMGNHRSYQEELTHQIELSERDDVPFALLLIDLDNLKVVNDREGHAEGDHLLNTLAIRMREAFRDTDRLFRIGGDEFAVILPDTEPEAAMEAAGRLRHYCVRPANGERPTPFSGGISAVPRFALESGQLYRQADVALYWAKRHGRGFVETFDPDRDQLPDDPGPDGVSNAVFEVARGRIFSPVFQPIVDLRTGAILGFEGLVRPDPEGPFPDADRLFTAAAATGRSVELDLACFEVVAAGARGISGDHIISFNLSSKTLEVKDFDSGWLLNTLVRFGISPSRVIVELTERDPIADVKRLQRNVRHLGEYGLRLAADDVGAGNSGLRLLSEVPFDIVKIDLSLVQDGAQHAASWAVLRSLRDLAWRQDAVVIGEGVETPEQLRALRQLDIPIGQGYLLGRPNAQPDASPLDLANHAALVAADGATKAAQDAGRRMPYKHELPVRAPSLRQLQPQALPAAQA